jgi:capsular exopolysaccharide synthesis family protein
MSYIFEALQRAEAERSGGSPGPNPNSVADLLQGVEQEIERRQGAAAGLPARTTGAAPTAAPVAAGKGAGGKAEGGEPGGFAAARVLTPALRSDSRLVCLTDQGGLAAEKFRVLGLKLRHLRERRKLRRIVVTGSVPEEGKSLVSANLALNQSRSKVLRTVLIDGDLRRPELGSRFGFSRSLPGLSEALRGERELADVVYRIDGSGLWFIPAGVTPENPIEVMQTARLHQVLEQLETFFDWIIIDTPPVVPLADTPLWMKLADGVLLVAREGVCDKKQLARAVEAIDRSAMLGVVINSCSTNEQKYYYARDGSAVADGEDASGPAGVAAEV